MMRNRDNFNGSCLEVGKHERFEALKKQESCYKNDDYLHFIKDGECVEKKQAINKRCRFIMAKWCFDAAEFCNYNEETVSITMSYLDKFLSSKEINLATQDTHWFQLAVMCSFQIAVKFNTNQNIDANALLHISAGSYTKEDILWMEKYILSTLSWRLCPPTPYVFLDFIFDCILPTEISNTTKEHILKISRKQLKLAITEYCFSLVDPSLVAFASVLNAMEIADDLLPKGIKKKILFKLSDIAGFKYLGQEKGHTLWSVKALLRSLLNGKSDAINQNKILRSATNKQNEHKERLDAISPTCYNALVA